MLADRAGSVPPAILSDRGHPVGAEQLAVVDARGGPDHLWRYLTEPGRQEETGE